MAKRKLNRRQQWRIEKIQAEKEKRLKQNEAAIKTLSANLNTEQSADQELNSDSEDFANTASKSEQNHEHEQRGLITARFGKQVEVKSLNTGAHALCHIRANIPDLVVGDEVVWQTIDQDTGIILSLCERESLLSRKDKHGVTKIIAANVSQVFVVIAPEPAPQTIVIDRYLVACKLLNLEVNLLINKDDLLEDHDKNISPIMNTYQGLVKGFSTCSIHSEEKMESFERKLKNNKNVLIGQSGVGKSSLVKKLTKDTDIITRSLSERTGLGVHTTSTSRLYALKHGGYIIDSPGIRDFDLDEISIEELQAGFSEFEDYKNQCKFRNCLHNGEPKCAINNAVTEGRISSQRHQNYLQIAESLSLLKN